MNMINIFTDEKRFYRQFLEILKSVPPINKLRPKELDVLAELMYQNNKYHHLGEVKNTVVFSTKVRKEMRDNLSMGEDSFNNNISILRKWKIIVDGNNLNNFLDSVLYVDGYKLQFCFNNKR